MIVIGIVSHIKNNFNVMLWKWYDKFNAEVFLNEILINFDFIYSKKKVDYNLAPTSQFRIPFKFILYKVNTSNRFTSKLD